MLLKKHSVLIIESNLPHALHIERILQANGHKVSATAYDVNAIEELVLQHSFDLILINTHFDETVNLAELIETIQTTLPASTVITYNGPKWTKTHQNNFGRDFKSEAKISLKAG